MSKQQAHVMAYDKDGGGRQIALAPNSDGRPDYYVLANATRLEDDEMWMVKRFFGPNGVEVPSNTAAPGDPSTPEPGSTPPPEPTSTLPADPEASPTLVPIDSPAKASEDLYLPFVTVP